MSITIVITSVPQAARPTPYIRVLSQYSEQFVTAAKGLDGQWGGAGSGWTFQDASLEDVENAALAAYGATGPSDQDISDAHNKFNTACHRIADETARRLNAPIPVTGVEGGHAYDIEPQMRVETANRLLQAVVFDKAVTAPSGLRELYDAAHVLASGEMLTDWAFRRKIRQGATTQAMEGLFHTSRRLEAVLEYLAGLDVQA